MKNMQHEKSTNLSGGSQGLASREEICHTAMILKEALKSFDVEVIITDISVGPSFTRFELQLAMGIEVSKVLSHTDDLKMRLQDTDIRIEAPMPGKFSLGIEIPNK